MKGNSTKLNKLRTKLVNDAKVEDKKADKLIEFLKIKGSLTGVLKSLQSMLHSNKKALEVVSYLEHFASYLNLMGILKRVICFLFFFQTILFSLFKTKLDFCMPIKRSYYSGLAFQVLTKSPEEQMIAAGGRYDKLISKFKTTPSKGTCAVGIKIAIEKIVIGIHKTELSKNLNKIGANLQVLICTVSSEKSSEDKKIHKMLEERMSIAKSLWKAGISAEYFHEETNEEKLYLYCKNNSIEYLVLLKIKLILQNLVKIIYVPEKSHSTVKVNEIVSFISSKLKMSSGETTVEVKPNIACSQEKIENKIESHPQIAQIPQQQTHPSQISNLSSSPNEQNFNETVSFNNKSSFSRNNQRDIVISFMESNKQMKSNEKKFLEVNLKKIVAQKISKFDSMRSSSVVAIELPFSVIKEMITLSTVSTKNIHAPVSKYIKFRDLIVDLKNFIIKAINEKLPFLFIYSVPDEKMDFMFLG